MNLLRQSTAVTIPLGPMVDSTDGNSVENALTISQADVRLKKNDGAWAQKAETSAATHEEAGWYEVALNTSDTDTLGHLIVAVHETGALPVWREFLVVTAAEYDRLCATLHRAGTAQGTGNDATHVKLAAAASATDDIYNGMVLFFLDGRGAGQASLITDYDGTTKIATISAIGISADATSEYVLLTI